MAFDMLAIGAVIAGALMFGAGLWMCQRARRAIRHSQLPLEQAASTPSMAARALALEAQLEFAPVALFRVGAAAPHTLEALNVSARRLLAPGRAVDAGQLGTDLAGLAGGQRRLIGFDTERGSERAMASAAVLTVDGAPQQLVALMPVEDELEAEAMQAWQKLVHVLTHEIMNSLTPVASLSHTSRELVKSVRGAIAQDVANDLDIALDAIGRRADSLTRFVSGYRQLASVPEAAPQRIDLARLCARMEALAGPRWLARGGRASFVVEPESLALLADAGQLEQALMSLLMNAEEASAHLAEPEVALSVRLARGGRLRIEVRDNGPGVPEDLAEQIFMPFFSTKPGGSGIGLAMVRQLVHRNGGTVRYVRSIGAGACFVINI